MSLKIKSLFVIAALVCSANALAHSSSFEQLVANERMEHLGGQRAADTEQKRYFFQFDGVYDDNGHLVANITYNGWPQQVEKGDLIDNQWKVTELDASHVKLNCIKGCPKGSDEIESRF